ncbi:MAG: type VII secretion system-associated protein [Pseudonocardiaceae bacterium]|nr:type VII secretion system-associated protein [Pseudonocardiaceae bacterium]
MPPSRITEDQATDDRPPPDITDDMRASAKENPNSWLYVMDPAFEAGDNVPPWGVVGAYPVDANGEIEPNFQPNEQYLPSPQALNLPLPTNELERLMQLVHTKHEPTSVLPPAILTARLHVYSDPEEPAGAKSGDGPQLSGFRAKDGRVLVPACTAEDEVPVKWPGSRELSGKELIPLLGEHPLVLNPEGVVTAIVPVEHLIAADRGGSA